MIIKFLKEIFTLFLFFILFSLPAAGLSNSDASTKESNIIYKRIISLYPAHTENIIHMGGISTLVGISTSDTNILAENIPKLSYRDDPERFIALSPDLVLLRPMIERSYPLFVSHLKKAGIAVLSIQPRNIKELSEYWLMLGKLCGREKEAVRMTDEFHSALSKINKKVAQIPENMRPGVYFQSIHSRMKTFSPTSISIFCLEQAGGRNIASDAKARFNTNIASYGKEKLLSHGDEIDVFLAQQGRMNPISVEIIKNEPGFSLIKAVKENKVFIIDEKIVSRPTPELIKGITLINKILYPTDNKR